MDAARDELADRIRALLSGEPDLEERSMFGTRAFLRNGSILVCARKGGVLLVRIADERDAALLSEPGTARAVMGARTMGSGWIDVSSEALVTDEALLRWLDAARESTA